MKKRFRIAALLAALAVLCALVTGCGALDDMRARHGYYDEDGNIRIGAYKYLPLPENEYFTPYNTTILFDKVNAYICVTERDVPVLLSEEFGNRYYIYNDGKILGTSTHDPYGVRYYCREDIYATLMPLMEKPFEVKGYFYTYKDAMDDGSGFRVETYRLTDEQVAVIDDVVATVEGDIPIGYGEDNKYVIPVYASTDSLLLRKDAYKILVRDGGYVLRTVDQGGNELTDFTVPAEYHAVFDDIVKAIVDAVHPQSYIAYSDV